MRNTRIEFKGIPNIVSYKGHEITLHSGSKRVNWKRWWYTIEPSNASKQYRFKARSVLGAEIAIQKTKDVIDRMATETYICFRCWDKAIGYGCAYPNNWGLLLDLEGMAQHSCKQCLDEDYNFFREYPNSEHIGLNIKLENSIMKDEYTFGFDPLKMYIDLRTSNKVPGSLCNMLLAKCRDNLEEQADILLGFVEVSIPEGCTIVHIDKIV